MDIVLLIVKDLRDPYFKGFAAQIAFYLLLSLVPIFLLLSQLLAVFSLSMDSVQFLLDAYGNDGVRETIEEFLSYKPNGTMNFVFLAVTLWAASRAQFFLSKIANYSITGELAGRGYIRERLRAIQTILLTLFTIVFSLLIMVYGQVLLQWAASLLQEWFDFQFTVREFWYHIRWPVAMLLYLATVSYAYFMLPTVRVRFREILPGSIFAALSMLIVTSLFSLYANNVANYSLLYGSLASLIAMMIWFYLLGWTLGLGVMLNKAWRNTKFSPQRE